MSQIDRFRSILEFTPHMGAGTNSVARMQTLFHSWGVTVSKRTIMRDFVSLEDRQELVFVAYSGAAKLFSKPKTKEVSLSPQLAWVLTKMKKNIERFCTAELINQIEPELAAAENMFNEKLKLDPQGKFNRFTRKIEHVIPMLSRTEIPAHIIEPIKETIYADDNDVLSVTTIQCTSAKQLKAVSIQELNNTLYLRGKPVNNLGQSVLLRLDDIDSVKRLSGLTFQQDQLRLKAA